MANEPHARVYEFGPFRIDTAKRLLQRDDEPLSLTPKAFEALLILVQNGGRVVSKEELIGKLWPDTFVGATTLAQNIFTLRKALDDDQNNPQYIKTIPRRGYRFIASVKESQGEEPGRDAGGPSHPHGKTGQAGGAGDRGYNSLAVLPLKNDTPDPGMDYLSEGIAESIINRLSQLPDLKVVARSIAFRHKGGDVEPEQVGRELNVQQVLSGRLVQFGNRLLIKVELVDVAKGWQLWGEQYDREASDILAVEKETAEHIAEALHLTLSGVAWKRITKNYTENDEAYQLYLKGRYCWNKQTEEGCLRAIEYFEKAIGTDGGYAVAYSGLADAYITLDFYGQRPPSEIMFKARAAALKALELDDMLAEAHVSLGCVKMLYDHDWESAEKEFKLAIKLKPSYPHAHSWYSLYLLALGRLEGSYAESKRALELDPLDIDINNHLSWYYLYTRQHDKAIEQLRRTLEMAPDCFLARLLLGRAYEQKSDFPAAVAEFEKASRLDRSPLLLGFLGHTYGVSGRKDEAEELLEELKDLSLRRYVPPYSLGLIYLGINEKAKALESFRVGSDISNEWLAFAKVNPLFDSLRQDPEFKEILRSMNLERKRRRRP